MCDFMGAVLNFADPATNWNAVAERDHKKAEKRLATEARYKMALRLFQEGQSFKQIAPVLGISTTRATQLAREEQYRIEWLEERKRNPRCLTSVDGIYRCGLKPGHDGEHKTLCR